MKKAWGFDKIDASKMTEEQKLELAYDYADYSIPRSQPSFSPEDLSGLQRGSPLEKLFTKFSAFTNTQRNMLYQSVMDLKKGHGDKFVKFAIANAVNVGGMFLIDRGRDELEKALFGKEPYEDDPLKQLGKKAVQNVTGMWYGVRDVANAVIRDQDNVELPIMRLGEKLVQFASGMIDMFNPELSDAQRKKARWNVLDGSIELLMMRRGYAYVIKQTGENLWEAMK